MRKKRMKYSSNKNILWSILLLVSSCKQNAEQTKSTIDSEVLFPVGTVGYEIYHNPDCPAKFTTNKFVHGKFSPNDLVIEFIKNRYTKKDSLYGKAYYSGSDLKNIAICNKLIHELILSIYQKDRLICKVSSKSVDTVYFAYPYPSRTEIDSLGRQEIKAYLRTSYSIANKKDDHYDTAMIRTFYFYTK